MDRRGFLKALAVPAVIPMSVVAVSTYPKDYHRVSTEKDDPGYISLAKLRSDGHTVKVYLDGIEQKNAVTADAREGFVKRSMVTEKGNIVVAFGEIINETLYGSVDIVIS